jgi:glycogen operon protein
MAMQDPVLAGVKLIAEPWDAGPGGYQLGNFPAPWSEWNGKYRDTVRDFTRGQPGTLPGLASGLAGSSEIFQPSGRRPGASVNFVTCHDGFALQDLVSYNGKHNEDNGEGNRDGSDDNRSWNCGAEGPSDDPDITALREQQKRNFMVTLLCSQGVPMLLAGDELGHTQGGNNNAYCQDSETSWLDWELSARQREFLGFVGSAVRLRRQHPVFRRRGFLTGRPPAGHGDGPGDVVWLTPAGQEIDWARPADGSMAVFLNGAAPADPLEYGGTVTDDSFMLLFNSRGEPVTFVLPGARFGGPWQPVLDTAATPGPGGTPPVRPADLPAGAKIEVAGHAVLVLRAPA